AHLAQDLAYNIDALVLVIVGVFGEKILHIMLDEDDIDDVLERLALPILLELLLLDELSDVANLSLQVATANKDRPDELGMVFPASLPPVVIAIAALGITRAGDVPAPDVLSARCDLQELGSIRVHPHKPVAHSLGVDSLVGSANSSNLDGSRILG